MGKQLWRIALIRVLGLRSHGIQAQLILRIMQAWGCKFLSYKLTSICQLAIQGTESYLQGEGCSFTNG